MWQNWDLWVESREMFIWKEAGTEERLYKGGMAKRRAKKQEKWYVNHVIVAIQCYLPGSVVTDHRSLNKGIKPDLLFWPYHPSWTCCCGQVKTRGGGGVLAGREYLIECWTPSDRRKFHYT